MTKINLSESRILYGLSMQAVYGDVNQEEPSKFDVIEWNKWDGWREYRGMSKKEA